MYMNVPGVKIQTLYPNMGTATKFWCDYFENSCVHISVQQVLYHGHCAQALSVNKALVNNYYNRKSYKNPLFVNVSLVTDRTQLIFWLKTYSNCTFLVAFHLL